MEYKLTPPPPMHLANAKGLPACGCGVQRWVKRTGTISAVTCTFCVDLVPQVTRTPTENGDFAPWDNPGPNSDDATVMSIVNQANSRQRAALAQEFGGFKDVAKLDKDIRAYIKQNWEKWL